MNIRHKKCAGLDVHAAFVAVCARTVRSRKIAYEEGRFATTTRDLLALAAWLEERGVTHVVREATGV